MTMIDYIVDARSELDARIGTLSSRARAARAEARHAREHPGLDGPARAAELEAKALDAQIAELREVALRVSRGYEWWDRDGFSIALDACGEPWRWQPLSESLTRDVMFAHGDADVRLPIDVQQAYGGALESGYFDRFEICQWFETDGDFVTETRAFLFAVTTFEKLGACTFLVAQWETA